MEKVNIMVGRFQPFTNGHLKCINEAWIKHSLKTVVLCIETPTTKQDKKHPFPTDVLRKAFEKLKADQRNIIDILYVKNANIVENSELCKMKGYLIAGWSCGTDRVKAYTDMAERYSDCVTSDFKIIEIERSDEDISATKIREAMLNDEQNYFKKYTPKALWPLYSKLKTILKKVYK